MDYIILDLEWNQGSEEHSGKKGLQFEIIEIGAVRLNPDKVIVGEFSQLIKPQVYHGGLVRKLCRNFLNGAGRTAFSVHGDRLI